MAETSSAEYSNSGGGQIVADVLARRQRAKVIRDLWMPLYQECFDYSMPYRQSFYEESPGQKRTHKIFDDTAVVGVQEFASRLQDGIAPANARFCDLLAEGDPPHRTVSVLPSRSSSRLDIFPSPCSSVPSCRRVHDRGG